MLMTCLNSEILSLSLTPFFFLLFLVSRNFFPGIPPLSPMFMLLDGFGGLRMIVHNGTYRDIFGNLLSFYSANCFCVIKSRNHIIHGRRVRCSCLSRSQTLASTHSSKTREAVELGKY